MKRILQGFLAVSLALATQAISDEALADDIAIWHSAPAGSPVDNIARIVARHIGRFLPGRPEAEVQSIPGGAGVNMLRRMERDDRGDGGVLGMASMSLILANRMDPETGYAPGFHAIGALTATPGSCIVRRDLNIANFSDFISRGLRLGSVTPASSTYREASAIRGVFDANFEIIVGLQSPGEALLAMHRQEIDGACGVALYTILNHPISEFIDFVGYLGATPHDDFRDRAGISIDALVEDPEDQEALAFISLSRQAIYSFWLAPSAPEDVISAYDTAFQALVTDPSFIAEVTPIIQVLTPSTRADLDGLITRISTTPQEIVDMAVGLIE